MARAKRSSALKARTAVQGLTSSFSFLDDPDEPVIKESESESEVEAEVVSIPSESSEDEASEKEDSPSEPEDDPSTEEDAEEDTEEEDVKPKRGRPKKGSKPVRAKESRKYVKVTEYSRYSPGPHPISMWKKAMSEVRPIKWGGKRKKAIAKFKRPPTDLLKLETALPEASSLPGSLTGLLDQVHTSILDLQTDSPSIEFTFQDQECRLGHLESKTVDGAVFAKAGCGAVTGMDWCRCCCKLLATSSYPSTDYKDYLIESAPRSSEIVIWKLEDRKEFSISPALVLKHNFGVARQLKWFPFHHKNGSFLAASFGNKSCRIIHVPSSEKLAVAHLTSSNTVSFENASCFSWGHTPTQFITGSFDGLITFWDLSSDAPRRIFSTRVGQKPIFTISPCPDNPNLFAIGGYEKHVFVLDISNPFDLYRHFSSINAIPNALWCPQGVIFWDSDSLLRLVPYNPPEPPHQFILTQFNSSTMDIALSTQHNVVAASSSDGSVHFFIIQSNTNTEKFFTIEYSVIKHCVESGGKPVITRNLCQDPRSTTYTMHNLATGATRLAWCTSSHAPGVLAIGTGSGLIMLQALDEYLLVKEGRS